MDSSTAIKGKLATFVIHSEIGGLVAAPDGNVWFTELEANAIGRITPMGVITSFPLPRFTPPVGFGPGRAPTNIVVGGDGALWFTEAIAKTIGRCTFDGVISEFPLPASVPGPSTTASLPGLAWGPDENIWFTENTGRVARMTPAGVTTEFDVGGYDPALYTDGPYRITAGKDGALWFTQRALNQIVRFTPEGTSEALDVPGQGGEPTDITTDAAGNLWFLDKGTNSVTRLTTQGDFKAWPLPMYADARSIRVAKDGMVWFTATGTNTVDRFDVETGKIAQFTPPLQALDLTIAEDGSVWFDTFYEGAGEATYMEIHRLELE